MQNLCRLNHYTWNAQQQKFSLSYSFPFGCRFSSTASSNTEEKQYGEFIAKLPSYVGGNVELELNNVNGVAVIKIDNPKSRNALTGYMITKLNDIVDQLHFWKEGKAVVMLGTKDQFCSGGDLRYFMNHMKTSQHGSFMCRYMQDLMMRFTNLPLLTVAAIQGNTLGGGAELSTACDFCVMQENAVLAFVQLERGITTGFGEKTRLVKLIGGKNAMKLLLSSRRLCATEAEHLNLIDGIFPTGVDVTEWCVEWMNKQNLLNVDARLIQSVKKMSTVAMNESIERSYAFERSVFERFWQGELHQKVMREDKKYR